MAITRAAITVLNAALGAVDAKIVRKSAYKFLFGGMLDSPPLPEGADTYLRPDHQRLSELRDRYRHMDNPATLHSRWTESYVKNIDLQRFRADGAFVWQRFSQPSAILTAYYVQEIDSLGLLKLMDEDGLFGAQVFTFNEELILSRDILDSVVDIYFLESALEIFRRPQINILDIGAGYGRRAHRMAEVLPALGKYFCVDSVAESTFVSEYYLRFRGIDQKAVVIPLSDIEEVLTTNHIDLAINVHSFSECTTAAIEWWLDLLQRHSIKHLMIAPNAEPDGASELKSKEVNGKRLDFSSIIRSKGYHLAASQPKYLHPSAQTYGISPTVYYLFELAS